LCFEAAVLLPLDGEAAGGVGAIREEWLRTQERVELNPSLTPVPMPGRVLNEMCAHALETLPEECCGLLSGRDGDPFQTVYRCRNNMTLQHRSDPVAYPRDGRKAYYMSEVDCLEAQKDSEKRGEVVTAVYHSHVAAGAYLSEVDRQHAEHELFPFPDAAQIVLAVGDGRVLEVGIFRRDPATDMVSGRWVQAAGS
jgi:proteasome lid subunit RPN8/RPN11